MPTPNDVLNEAGASISEEIEDNPLTDAAYFKRLRKMPEADFQALRKQALPVLGIILDVGSKKYMDDVVTTAKHMLISKDFFSIWTNSNSLPKLHERQFVFVGSDDVSLCRCLWETTHVLFFWTGSADCKSAIEASMRMGRKRIVIKVDRKTGEMVRLNASKPRG